MGGPPALENSHQTSDKTMPRWSRSVSSRVRQHVQLVITKLPFDPSPEQDCIVVSNGTPPCHGQLKHAHTLGGALLAFLSTSVSQRTQVGLIASKGGPDEHSLRGSQSAIAILDDKCCKCTCNFLSVGWSGHALLSSVVHSGGKQHVASQGLARKTACHSAKSAADIGQDMFIFSI